MPYVGRVAPEPSSIMTKLWYCDITRWSDIVTEQERSHSIATRLRPSNAVRKSVRTAVFETRRY